MRDLIDQINGVSPEPSITPPAKGTESWYRNRLATKLNGKVEVQTEVGRIDILTAQQVIEVKRVSGWKSAIGQVKSYGIFYPKHQLRIHLFGVVTARKLKTIEEICQEEGILLTWENDNTLY